MRLRSNALHATWGTGILRLPPVQHATIICVLIMPAVRYAQPAIAIKHDVKSEGAIFGAVRGELDEPLMGLLAI